MDSRECDTPGVESLRPSCQYVYAELESAGGELSRQQLLERTYLAPRTLDSALDTLESCALIDKTRKSSDLREVVVQLADERNYKP